MTQQHLQNEFEIFADIKRNLLKAGMSEEMFNQFISQVEVKLWLTFFNITSSLLHQALNIWVMLQLYQKKDKVSFLTLSRTPDPVLRCLLCDTYPVYAASYIDKNRERALFYFACNDHYIGTIPEEEKKHNVMNEVEDLADQFYEMRKEMGMSD
jgi:hypothetical protein